MFGCNGGDLGHLFKIENGDNGKPMAVPDLFVRVVLKLKVSGPETFASVSCRCHLLHLMVSFLPRFGPPSVIV